MYICMYIYIYVCMYVCIYIYMYMYTHSPKPHENRGPMINTTRKLDHLAAQHLHMGQRTANGTRCEVHSKDLPANCKSHTHYGKIKMFCQENHAKSHIT